MNVKMVPDNKTLDEVVVVGYGSMKRGDLTGSVASVASKDIEGYKSSSVMGALGGQIAGVQITQTDGTPVSYTHLYSYQQAGENIRTFLSDRE